MKRGKKITKREWRSLNPEGEERAPTGALTLGPPRPIVRIKNRRRPTMLAEKRKGQSKKQITKIPSSNEKKRGLGTQRKIESQDVRKGIEEKTDGGLFGTGGKRGGAQTTVRGKGLLRRTEREIGDP